jgi:hypothetical protein
MWKMKNDSHPRSTDLAVRNYSETPFLVKIRGFEKPPGMTSIVRGVGGEGSESSSGRS